MKFAYVIIISVCLSILTVNSEGATVQMKNGKSFTGEITEMNSEHVLLDMDGATVTIKRDEVAAIDMTGAGITTVTAQPTQPAKQEQPAPVTIPANTILMVSIGKTISSGSAKVGEPFTGNLTGDVRAGQQVVFPAGSTVEGRVSSVSKASRGIRKKPGMLNLEVLRIIAGNQVVAVATALEQESGEAKKGSLAKGAARGAAGGALFGQISKDDAGSGAAAGAATGAARGFMNAGDDVTITKGSVLAFSLRAPATL